MDWSMIGIDSTSCRAHQHAAGAARLDRESQKKDDVSAPPPLRGNRPVLGQPIPQDPLTGEDGYWPTALLLTPSQWGEAP